MAKILCIIRTSTIHQETESQKKELMDYCTKSLGFKPDELSFIEVSGASAVKENQKYLNLIQKMKDELINGNIKNVALWHLNRLGRKESTLIKLKEFFINNGIQVYIKIGGFKLLDDHNNESIGNSIMWNIMSAMIQFDTLEMKAKTQRGIKRQKENGYYSGGGLVYGYSINPKTKLLEKNSDEIQKIEEIFKLYGSGKYSIKTLYSELNQRGFTFRGKKLSLGVMEKLLRYNFEGLLDKDIIENVKKIKTEINKKAEKNTKHISLGIKICKCPDCGNNLILSDGYYGCLRHKESWKVSDWNCSYKSSLKKDFIDALLWKIASDIELFKLKDIKAEDIKKYQDENYIIQQKLKTFNSNLLSLSTKQNKIKEMYIEGDLDKKEYNQRKGKLLSDSIHIQREIERLNNEYDINEDKIKLAKSQINNPNLIHKDILENADINKKKEIVLNNIVDLKEELNSTDVNSIKEKIIIVKDRFGKVYRFLYSTRSKTDRFKIWKNGKFEKFSL